MQQCGRCERPQITLRDFFAGCALAGLMATHDEHATEVARIMGYEEVGEMYAKAAIEQADFMLAAKKAGEETTSKQDFDIADLIRSGGCKEFPGGTTCERCEREMIGSFQLVDDKTICADCAKGSPPC